MTTDKNDLLPCPFCGGKPELIIHRPRTGYGSYERTHEVHVVECKNCAARSRGFEQKPLCDYTNYTVADFRENPILRAKVEDGYAAYAEQTKELAVDAWNTRAR